MLEKQIWVRLGYFDSYGRNYLKYSQKLSASLGKDASTIR